ncbi:rhodanese-like domain-containing protein [Kitasatospora sp. NPDC018616]|uniref:rhodanese-like domain-containing protein n=1 Tax=Kitasatospora sp. NPDC018616 TaxID=3364027 RepID=UPI0037BB8F4A
MTTPLTVEQLQPRLGQLTLIDVRSPGEYAAGHIPGALNVPLDQLGLALPALREAAGQGEIAVVCAAGPRADQACRQLADAGIPTLTLTGGTNAWAGAGPPRGPPARAPGGGARAPPGPPTAGALVLAGILLDLALPGARWLAAAVGGGLAFSALTNTCAMGSALARLPYNRARPGAPSLDETLAALRR